MVNLIYIVSPGHSGSTLLDMLLGSLPGVFSLGECTYLPWQLYRNGKVVAKGRVEKPGLRGSYARITWLAEGERVERGLAARVVYNPPPVPPKRPGKRIAREHPTVCVTREQDFWEKGDRLWCSQVVWVKTEVFITSVDPAKRASFPWSRCEAG